MNFDFGSLFSQTFAIFRQRFWPMLGLWATFIGIIFGLFLIYFVVIGASMMGFAALNDGSDPGSFALGGASASLILSAFVFYFGMLVLIFAQQGAMCAKATPIEDVTFGESIGRGLKTGLTLAALMIPLFILQFILGLLAALLAGLASFASPVLGVAFAILLVPVAVYFACRFAVLVPVIAVERVLNPIKAVNRAWSITQGKVLPILVVLLFGGVVGFALFGIPVLLVGTMADQTSPIVALVPLLMFPVLIGYTIFVMTLNACLHARISDYGAQNAAEIFE